MAVPTRLVRRWADHIKQKRWVFDDHLAYGPVLRLDGLLRAVLGEKTVKKGHLLTVPAPSPLVDTNNDSAYSGASHVAIGDTKSVFLQKPLASGSIFGENTQLGARNSNFSSLDLTGAATDPNKGTSNFLKGRLPPGYHFTICNQSNQVIGADGYDDYQAPFGDKALFSRRMWASGSLDYIGPEPRLGDAIQCVETVLSVRQVQNSVFVRINRDFSNNKSRFLTEIRTLVYTNNNYNVSARQEARKEPLLTDIPETENDPQNAQNSSESSGKKLPFGPKVCFSENQILAFSMLMSNLHKIHFDRAHSMAEGLRGPVVPGPLLVAAGLAALSQARPDLQVRLVKYTNRRPLYCHQQTALIGQQRQRALEVALTDDNGPYISAVMHVDPPAGRLNG